MRLEFSEPPSRKRYWHFPFELPKRGPENFKQHTGVSPGAVLVPSRLCGSRCSALCAPGTTMTPPPFAQLSASWYETLTCGALGVFRAKKVGSSGAWAESANLFLGQGDVRKAPIFFWARERSGKLLTQVMVGSGELSTASQTQWITESDRRRRELCGPVSCASGAGDGPTPRRTGRSE
jgi:hypothetical protein